MSVFLFLQSKYKNLGNLLSQRSRGKLLNLEMYGITVYLHSLMMLHSLWAERDLPDNIYHWCCTLIVGKRRAVISYVLSLTLDMETGHKQIKQIAFRLVFEILHGIYSVF